MIATHIANVTFADLPQATVHATRRALLDAVGVILAASGTARDAEPYLAHALAQPDGTSRLFGANRGVPPGAAALANGALAHALDFGDTFDPGPAHPNAALVPALAALADADPAIDTARFLTAMTLGSDLACRLSLAPERPFEAGGWYPPPLTGLIAAAAACARLIGLDADGIRHAMGLALLQASFPAEIKYDGGSPLRGVREGFAARAAVEAALLAQAGARAFAQPLEGRAGFFAIYGGGGPRPVLTHELGTRFLGDAVSFKPWPCCRGTHAYIEAALDLRGRCTADAIVRLEAETGPMQEMLIRPHAEKAAPRSAIEAKFSIPFTTAHGFVHGAVTLDSFSDSALADPVVLDLATRVVESRNPAWGREHAASGSLTAVLRSGERLVCAISHAAGDPARPLSDAALVAKFIDCASRARIARSDSPAVAADRILTLAPDRPATALFGHRAIDPRL